MNIEDWFGCFWGLLGFMCGVMFCNFASHVKIQQLKDTAIEKGVAEYNSTTGDWQWKDTLQEE
jgi:hypothetical protein